MNKSAVRRALTTLKKQGLIENNLIPDGQTGKVMIYFFVDGELTQTKSKKSLKTKKVKNVQTS